MKMLVLVVLAILALTAVSAEKLAYSPAMKYMSPAGYARLRAYTESGKWEADPLGLIASDKQAYTEVYGYMSVAGSARLGVFRHYGVWVSFDEALAISDFGDDTFSFLQRLDEEVASAK